MRKLAYYASSAFLLLLGAGLGAFWAIQNGTPDWIAAHDESRRQSVGGSIAPRDAQAPEASRSSPNPSLRLVQPKSQSEGAEAGSAQRQQEATAAESELQQLQTDYLSSGIEDAIARQKQLVTELQARARNPVAKNSTEIQNQALLIEQNNQVMEQRLADLRQQMQNVQQSLSQVQFQIQNTAAPDTSDVMVALNNRKLDAQNRLQQLQQQYQSVLDNQQQLAATRYQNQAQESAQQQSGAIGNDVSLQQAQSQLQTLMDQRQQLLARIQDARKRAEELRSGS